MTDKYKFFGFELCQFEADKCERCGNVAQLYFGNKDYWDGREGDCWCSNCIDAIIQENQAFLSYMSMFQSTSEVTEMERVTIYIVDDRVKDSLMATLEAAKHEISTALSWNREDFSITHEIYDNGLAYYRCYIPPNVDVETAKALLTSLKYIF